MNAQVQSAVAAVTRTWSEPQLNCFEHAAVGQGNAIVIARAGSGKTTTGVEMVKRVRGSHIYLAFNKSIATELSARGVNGRTFHSLCYGIVLKHKGASTVTSDKLRKLCDANLSGNDARMYGAFITKLVGLGRNMGIGCLIPDVEQSWLALVEHHNLELEHDDADLGRALELAASLLGWSNASNMIDFDDMLYLAVKDGLVLPKFDNVFLDEAQDTNAIQRALVRKVMKPTSRLFAIGDPAQAIYGFRGADSDSMELLRTEFNCKELPLTVTYRCGTSIVEFAQQWVKDIQAAPGAPAGSVTDLVKWDAHSFAVHDLVVCRNTAPIVTLGFKLLKARVPVRIMGKEIGEGLKSLIKKMNGKDLDHLTQRLEDYRAREVEKATAKQEDAKVAAINDKVDAILCLIEGLEENRRSIRDLLEVIGTLFADATNVVTLATIHKAKGLEADRVFWLNSSKCPSKWARQEWQKQQEVNLCYVAATRAKSELVLIEEPKK